MLLRKASQLIIGDHIYISGRWCVENVSVSDDSTFISLILSNRQHVLDDPAPVSPVELKRMTVRRSDYLSIVTQHVLHPFEPKDQ
jgi:hypothetical protein